MHIYKLTIIALLSALAVGGRIIFTYLPNIQPVTDIIIIGGIFLGPLSAFIMAFIITFLSNVLLGMGIWSIWQALSWGIIGILSGVLAKKFHHLPTWALAIYAALCGYFYGFMISLVSYQVAGHFWPYYLAGLPFDNMHAIGNAVLMFILYPILARLFKKYAANRFPLNNEKMRVL
ncbi:ECF transporter S component [Oceanobacillus piezotolerans]|uniref:ECF transporter S component n=1 Tax=Oceanobacillus piezotolerans TaxID=2448030 RepID=A0A498D915_9BACI|nr:ECF transporter S component [Oceanobacillus piezotolerans]RLL43677.1 ECF transporter S component [Oceanobacillus piezotolerans]